MAFRLSLNRIKVIPRNISSCGINGVRFVSSYNDSNGDLTKNTKLVKFPKVGHTVPLNETAGDAIDYSTGLQRYVQRVTRTTGKYLGITALSGAGTVGTTVALSNIMPPDMLMTGGAIAFFGAFGTSLWSAWKLDRVDSEKDKEFYARLTHGGMGVTLAPSLVVFSDAIPMASVLTAALVAGPVTASLRLQKGTLLSWGPALYTGLWGLLGVSVGGIFFPVLHDINLIGGVGLFTAYSAYDTHAMIDDYEKGKRDHIGHASNFSLNAINIFVRMLEIVHRLNEKKIE